MTVQLPRPAARPWVIAHRGVPAEAPENTLAGFARAIDHGADLIELDVCMSADGHAVVMHDDTVDRTTDGSGRVDTLTLAELRALDAGSWLSPDFTGERVPTLREALDFTRGKVGVVIELKASSAQYPGIETEVLACIDAADRRRDVIVISGDHDAIVAFRSLAPTVPALCFQHPPLTETFWQHPPVVVAGWRNHANVVFGLPRDLNRSVNDNIHAAGLTVLTSIVWEPDVTPELVAQIVASGVDGIFTDDARTLKRLIAAAQ